MLGRLGDTARLEELKRRFQAGPSGLQRSLAAVHADALGKAGAVGQALTVLEGSLVIGADPATVLPKIADVFL